MLHILVVFYLASNLLENVFIILYTVLAAQGIPCDTISYRISWDSVIFTKYCSGNGGKSKTLACRRLNVGSTSSTLTQHWAGCGPMCRVCSCFCRGISCQLLGASSVIVSLAQERQHRWRYDATRQKWAVIFILQKTDLSFWHPATYRNNTVFVSVSLTTTCAIMFATPPPSLAVDWRKKPPCLQGSICSVLRSKMLHKFSQMLIEV